MPIGAIDRSDVPISGAHPHLHAMLATLHGPLFPDSMLNVMLASGLVVFILLFFFSFLPTIGIASAGYINAAERQG